MNKSRGNGNAGGGESGSENGVTSGSTNAVKTNEDGSVKYGVIVLDISNSVLPLDKLNTPNPSATDGLTEEEEISCRSSGCDLIQIAGKLLKLPQVAMATGCILFQRFYYAKSLVRHPYDIVAMATVVLACKIEESPRRVRDIINVFNHIRQVRNGKPIEPVVLDQNYINLKNQVIKAERRVLKELGFCVHVKHPHKIIVMYLKWLEFDTNKELLQMSWNFMNDSLRTDVFVRYPPETIATACIYLSARKLKIPMPKNPSWFDVLGVEEDDIKDCCYRMICLYNRTKPNQEELEKIIENLRKKVDESRRMKMAREQQNSHASQNSPVNSSNNANNVSPANNNGNGEISKKPRDSSAESPSSYSRKKKKHKRSSRSRSPSYDENHHHHHHHRGRSSHKKNKKSHRRSSSRSPGSPPSHKKYKKSHKDHKNRYRSRSRSRDRYDRGYRQNENRFDKQFSRSKGHDNYYRR